MRKLMWFAIGFGAACAFCAYFWITQGLILPAMICFAAFAGLVIGGRWVAQLKKAAVVCLGIGLALVWFQGYSSALLSPAAALDGQVADVSLNCTDYSYQTDYGTAVEGYLYLNGRPCKAKLYVNGDVYMEPGDVLNGQFELRVTTDDSDKGATFHPGKGIFLLGYQEEDAQLIKSDSAPIWARPAMLRRYLIQTIDDLFPEDTAAFAKALLLGDRTEVSYEMNTAFKISGIMHVIAVSGLHVTILFTLINLLCLKRRWLVALLGIPFLLLFTAVAGFTPSVTRACIMQCLMIFAALFDKESDGPTALSFAALVMLIANPLVITSVSFQLSVGCMIGIFLFQKKTYDWLCGKLVCVKGPAGLKRWLAGSVSVTLSAISLTTPLSAYYFGAVSLVGVLTNLLTLWVITFIFYGIILVCTIGVTIPAAGAALAGIISWPVRYVLWISELLASVPFAAVYTRSAYITAWLVFCYVLFGIFLAGKKKQPVVLTGCVVFGLLISIAASCLEPRTDSCRMTVLNVGQGQSIILQSEGKTYLVDCGGSYDVDAADLAAETLLSQGVFRIDGLIVTHYDSDHAGGAAYFLTRIPTDMIFIPDYEDENGIRETLEQMVPGGVCVVDENVQIAYGTTSITLYGPVLPDSGNESSLAVLFQKENCDILITGDRSSFGERMLLKEADLPELEILVAGHHGAKDSTCEELLEATLPKIVAISVGRNSYGHPAQEVLNRLDRYGCMIYRTDLDGNIIFRR